MRPTPHLRLRSLLALLALLSLLAGAIPAPAAAREPAAGADEPVRVIVAVLPFRVNSAEPLDYLEDSLAGLLSTRLEQSGRVEVLESVTVRESLIAHAGERTEEALRELAREVGADYVVAGSLTELAGRYSLDVRVTPVESRYASETMVWTAPGQEALLDRIGEASERILRIVVGEGPRARVAAVHLRGAGEREAELRERLRLAEGAPFERRALRTDVERLRGLDWVASARADTERGPEGVTVTYELVPGERLLPEGGGEAAEETVAEVRVRGNRRIEAGAIRARLTVGAGDPFEPEKIAADVRAIHELGFFRDVRVYTEDGPEGKVLIYDVEENPVVRQVTISGNDNVDGDRIRDKLTLTTGSTLDLPLLYENRDRIAGLYRAEGYYLADVDYEIEERPGDAVAIHFEVTENEKLKLRRIVFEGNEHFSDDELKEGFKTKPWRIWSWVTRFVDRSGTYSEPVFLQDIQKVQDRYMDAGFLRAQVSEPRVETVEDGLVVRVAVEEGPRFRVGEVEVEGDPTMDLEALRELIQLEEGEYFNRSHLTNDVEALERYYTNRGFFQAKVNPRTRPREGERIVDVTFQAEKGPLNFIRQIDIAGNTTTVDSVVRREMRIVEGELYSARALDLSRARVKRLGYFEEVTFEPEPTDHPDQLDLNVKVVEKPTGSLSFGAGFSSQDGFILNGSLSQSNLFGRGYGARVSADIGGRTSRFFLSFTDPYFLGSTFSLSSSLFRTDIEFEDFEQEQAGVELNLSHALDEAGRSRGALRYSFTSREVRQDSGVNAAAVIFRQILAGSETTSLAGLRYRRDTRNDRAAPTDGQVLGASMEYAGLGGISQFLRLEGRASFFVQPPDWFPSWFPFKEKSTFIFAARTGYTFPFNDISDFDFRDQVVATNTCFPGTNDQVCTLDAIDRDVELPLTERYFLGGLGSFQLRGFRARSVGPRRAILYDTSIRGLFGQAGARFAPVGRNGATGVCQDVPGLARNTQGDKDGVCNDIDDQDIDDFEDLDETDVIGGNKFFSATVEYRFPVAESFGLMGIVFLDMGNAFAENESLFDVDKWRYGTGVGVQWFSPFGPLQAFVGFPLDKLEVEDPQVFEFSVGGRSF